MSEREEFEAWAGPITALAKEDGKYIEVMTSLAWEAWQAARALAAPTAPTEPVAWMSPGKERLEFSRPDTVYGSHTIPLYATPPSAVEAARAAVEASAIALQAEQANLELAVIGVRHFGNPIPKEWYAAARELLAATPSATTAVEPDEQRYQLLRRGQHWSVIDGIGNVLRGDDLDAAVDSILAARASKGTK